MGEEQWFGEIVKTRRRELGLTQDELARRVGCAPITLRKIEADDLRPSVQIAERMAMALNIPLEERAGFVHIARLERSTQAVENITPLPMPDEIGSEDLSGRAIRGYALGERIGSGGMGAVYRAIQPLVEREVAIKIILPRFANQPEFIRRFEAEAQLVARLEHPHIVPLYDYWREPGVAYLVMRLLRGGNLEKLLRSSPLPADLLLRIMEQVCSALGAAHRAGVIHRDLKPANVLLDDENNAYLADFGIAKNLSSLSSETLAHAIIGSPDYISPEQVRAELIRPQTDIYALGVMLYELLTGVVPFRGPTPFDVISQHLSTPLPPLAANRDNLPGALDGIIARATFKDPLARYTSVEEMLAELRQVIVTEWLPLHNKVTLPGLQSFPALPFAVVDNPYKGLRAFEEADAQDFYGREAFTQQLLVRMGEDGDLARFLAVVGPSGSGKSSVVKAGLLPALRRGALPGSENWFIIDMLPGPQPLEELEAALLRVAVNPPASLLEQLRSDKRGLLRAIQRCLPDDPAVELVLVIDQFEEIFTLVQDESTRAHFLDLLVTSVLDDRSRVRIVLTLRADFIDRPLGYVDFGEILRQRMEIVLPLTPDELERAITAPAERVGLKMEPGLVADISRDLDSQPGSLPLLQYAMTQMFEQRASNTFTRAAYQSIGGILGALGRKADEVFAGLDETTQLAARQVFIRLVTLGEGAEDTRRRVLRSELENLVVSAETTPDAGLSFSMGNRLASILDVFGRSRLLSFDRDLLTRGATIEVAHEALLREWPHLREWLTESRADVRMQRNIAVEVAAWLSAGRDPSYLLTGARLAQFEAWAQDTSLALTGDERTFLQASLSQRERSQADESARQQRELVAAQKLAETEHQARLRMRNRNWIITGLGILALIAAVFAVLYAFRAQSQQVLAQQQRTIALTQQAAAEAQKNIAQQERLAAEAYRIASDPGGNSETAALLSIRALAGPYSPEADAALVQSMPNLLTRFIIHPDPLASGYFALSPDGKLIATAQIRQTVQLWDAHTGQFLRTLKQGNTFGSEGTIYTISFSPDGKWLLAQSGRGDVDIINVEDGKSIRTFGGWGGTQFAPDSKSLIEFEANSLVIWDVLSNKRLNEIKWPQINMPGCAASVVELSADGRSFLAGCSDGKAYLFDSASGAQLQVFSGLYSINTMAFSPDGTLVLIGNSNNDALLYQTASGQLLHTLHGHIAPLLSVAFSPDGKSILTGGWDNTARLWDTASGNLEHIFSGQNGAVLKALFSPDGKSIFTGGKNGEIRAWRIPDNRLNLADPAARFEAGAVVGRLLPDNQSILLLLEDPETAISTLRFVQGASGNVLQTIKVPRLLNADLSPDGKTALITRTTETGSLTQLFNIQTGQAVPQFTPIKDIQSALFSPDGSMLVSQDNDGSASIWNAKTGENLHRYIESVLYYYVTEAWSPDSKSFLVADTSGIVHLYDTQAYLEIKAFGTPSDASGLTNIFTTAFSPDGGSVLLGGSDGGVRLWDIHKGTLIREYKGHTDQVYSVAFSPDGKFILTASLDKTVRLWEANTGKLIRVLSHKYYVGKARFSPDGKFILSSSFDGVHLWDSDYHDTIRAACSLLIRDLTPEERAQYDITGSEPTCPAH